MTVVWRENKCQDCVDRQTKERKEGRENGKGVEGGGRIGKGESESREQEIPGE